MGNSIEEITQKGDEKNKILKLVVGKMREKKTEYPAYE